MKSRAEHLRSAQAVLDGAKAAGRDLTSSEQATVQGHFDQIEAIDARAKSAEVREADALMNRMKALGAGSQGPGDRDAFDGPGFDREGVKSGMTRALRAKSAFGFNMPLTKAALGAGGLSLPSSGKLVSDQPLAAAVVALRELLEPVTAESGRVRYYQMGAGSAAEVVAEGGLKPDLGASVTPVDADLKKIATTFSFTDELLEDADFLVSHVQREALRQVLLKENELITTELAGLTGALTATGTVDEAIDVLAAAIGATQAANGVTPTRILANPADVATIRTSKATGSGEYNLEPLTAGPSSVHGVEVTATPAVAAGSMYLLSPGAGVFYTRESGVRVETGFTGDDWVHNRVTTRVEERVLPAIVRPSLVTQVTLTTV